MDSQLSEPHTFCKKCCHYIKTNHFLIHQTRCNGVLGLSQSRQSQRIFSNSRPSQQSQQPVQQTIPCTFCGYLQTFAELDTHPSRCAHREEQCNKCGNSFPHSLMGQHEDICPANQRQPQPEHPEYEEEYEGYEPDYQILRRRPQMLRNRSDPMDLMNMMMMNEFSSSRPSLRSRESERQGSRLTFINSLNHLIELLASSQMAQQEKGLSKEEISEFPVSDYKPKGNNQADQDMCIICYCAFQQKQKCLTLPCTHSFHPQCVETWLEKNPTCPVCKHSFAKAKEEELEPYPPPRRSSSGGGSGNGNGLFRIFRF